MKPGGHARALPVALAVLGLAGCGTDMSFLQQALLDGGVDTAEPDETIAVPVPGQVPDAAAAPAPRPIDPVRTDAAGVSTDASSPARADRPPPAVDARPADGPPRAVDARPAACLTCQGLGATCGTTPDGCGGLLVCGSCADALTTCGAELSCVCGRATALYSPDGGLESGKRAVAPDLKWYATAGGIFATTTGQMLWPLIQAKGFDWHPDASGRFARMEHHTPPLPAAVVTIYQLSDDGRQVRPVARATSDRFHHYMAWTPGGGTLALGGESTCSTVTTVTPTPLP
jgi:hypothetical protein